MENYLLEAALLMLAAYLLGAVIGCFARRLLTSPQKSVERPAKAAAASAATTTAATAGSEPSVRAAPDPVQPKIETVAQPEPPENAAISDSARFERVLTSGQASEPAQPASPPVAEPAEPAAPAASNDSGSSFTATDAASAAAAAAAAVVAGGVAAATARSEDNVPTEPLTQPEPEPAPAPTPVPAAQPAPQLPIAGGSTGSASVAATIAAAPAGDPADDLRRIAHIDAETANNLNHLGYTRYADIADWKPDDVARVKQALGNDRATREGWAEQAKLLAAGKETNFTLHGREATAPLAAVAGGTLPEPRPLPKTEPEPEPAPVPSAAPASAPATSTAQAQAQDNTVAGAVAATAAAAAATAAAATTAAAAPAAADDLTRIQGIDTAAASKLRDLGVTSYRQIADWKPGDVARMDGEFVKGRVSRENWLEQAKMLADGKETGFTKRIATGAASQGAPHPTWSVPTGASALAVGVAGVAAATAAATAAPVAKPAAPSPEPSPAPAPAASPAPTPAAADDDLRRIQGIDDSVRAMLQGRGVTRYAQIADWTPQDVADVDNALGMTGRVSRENWQEQAKMLAAGKETAYTRRAADNPGMLQSPHPTWGLASTSGSVASGAALSAQTYREGTVAASGGVATAPFKGASSSAPDLDQVPVENSAIDHADADTASGTPSPSASEPASDPNPATARPARLADAIRQNAAAAAGGAGSGVAGMRSVRSQLLAGGGKAAPETVDDLKKIRGIGVLIEKKLNAMGIYSYDQIANWSAGDIERVSSSLDFKGRIEREGWVQQARILASGGQTEFSKRLT